MPEPAPETEPAPTAEDVDYCPECGAMRKDKDEFFAVCGHDFNAPAGEAAKPAPAPAAPVAEDSSDEAPTDYDAE